MRLIYWPMTIERSMFYREIGTPIRVLHKGQDVTHRCRFADDTPGEECADLVKLDPFTGKSYFDPHDPFRPAAEIVRGDIVIEATRA